MAEWQQASKLCNGRGEAQRAVHRGGARPAHLGQGLGRHSWNTCTANNSSEYRVIMEGVASKRHSSAAQAPPVAALQRLLGAAAVGARPEPLECRAHTLASDSLCACMGAAAAASKHAARARAQLHFASAMLRRSACMPAPA